MDEMNSSQSEKDVFVVKILLRNLLKNKLYLWFADLIPPIFAPPLNALLVL